MNKLIIFYLIALLFSFSCSPDNNAGVNHFGEDKYYVAAYIWSSCHDEKISRKKFWGQGIGEWEIIKTGEPKFEGYSVITLIL